MHNQIIGCKSKTSITSFFKIIPKKPPAAPQIDNTIKPKVMKSSSTQLLPSTPDIQDILETAHRNKSPLKLSLFQRQVSSFLQEFCPQLNSDDVLCNEIFIEGFQVSAAKISEYQSLLKLYLGDVSRKRKSDLTSKITDINKQLDMLKNKMLKASDIKLDLKKGTMHLSILAAQKSSFLCEIVATASKIRDKTQNCKLKERLAEQSQCKNKDLCKVMEPELKLKCLNIDLLWVKGYHNLEIRNLKRIPANTKFT